MGATETLTNIALYSVHQGIGPLMYAKPTTQSAKWFSEHKLLSAIEQINELAGMLVEKDWYRIASDKTFINCVGADTSSSIASPPYKVVLADGIDKYPVYQKEIGSVLELMIGRTKTFRDPKVFLTGTPTKVGGETWQNLLRANIVYRYQVPCPHCGVFQTLEVEGLPDINEIKQDTPVTYKCKLCGKSITDHHKSQMLLTGKWAKYTVAMSEQTGKPIYHRLYSLDEIKPSHAAYQMSALYSPWVTFGEFLHTYGKAINDVSNKHAYPNFVTNWQAEPWNEKRRNEQRDYLSAIRVRQHTNIPTPERMSTCSHCNRLIQPGEVVILDEQTNIICSSCYVELSPKKKKKESCRHFFSWETVHETGVWKYQECRKCSKRRAKRAGGSLSIPYQPVDSDWVNGKTDQLNIHPDLKHDQIQIVSDGTQKGTHFITASGKRLTQVRSATWTIEAHSKYATAVLELVDVPINAVGEVKDNKGDQSDV
jgi:hypothetical protein